jgi:hypothetical protein
MRRSHSHHTTPANKSLTLDMGRWPMTARQMRALKRQHTRRSRRWWRSAIRQLWDLAIQFE